MSLVCSTLGLTLEPPAASNQTLAEWVNLKLGRPPEAGAVVQVDGVTITARKLRRKKTYEAILTQ